METTAAGGGKSPGEWQNVPVTKQPAGEAELPLHGALACFAPFARSYRTHQVVDQELLSGSVSSQGAMEGSRESSDWGSLLPGLLCNIFSKVKEGHTGWPQRKTLFTVAGICTNWRASAYEVFFNAQHCSSTITHPCELFLTRPYSTTSTLLHCLVVRERHPSEELPTQYFMYLGEPEQEQYEKFLLAASHSSRLGKDRFNIRMCADFDAATEAIDSIAVLKTNIMCTNYSLDITWPRNFATSRPLPSTKLSSLGSMKYRRNFFGFRGPRKLNVQFPVLREGGSAVDDGSAGSSLPSSVACSSSSKSQWRNVGTISVANRQPDAERDLEEEEIARPQPSNQSGKAGNSRGNNGSSIVLKNVPPHWHELLQCWCLNFGGRVKEASVKNFQLMHVGDEAVAMQFGKVSKDTFILDFNPTKISPVQAFSVALSSFESKLPYE